MLRTRVLARVLVPVLGAMAIQAAEEPAAPPPPPAKSIREWRMTPEQAAAASAEAAPAVPAKSIREWRTPQSTATAPCPMAAPIASVSATPATNPPAKPAASAAARKSPITISIKSTMRQGNLVVMLDGVPVFSEKFTKPLLIISQTTTWDPLQVAPGNHRLTAKVLGTKKTYFSKDYDLYVSPTKGSTLRFVMQGDKLTVALAS